MRSDAPKPDALGRGALGKGGRRIGAALPRSLLLDAEPQARAFRLRAAYGVRLRKAVLARAPSGDAFA